MKKETKEIISTIEFDTLKLKYNYSNINRRIINAYNTITTSMMILTGLLCVYSLVMMGKNHAILISFLVSLLILVVGLLVTFVIACLFTRKRKALEMIGMIITAKDVDTFVNYDGKPSLKIKWKNSNDKIITLKKLLKSTNIKYTIDTFCKPEDKIMIEIDATSSDILKAVVTTVKKDGAEDAME